METYRIHEQGNRVPHGQVGSALVAGRETVNGKAPEAPAFDYRLNRLRSLVSHAGEQSKRLDNAVMRLSGLSPPGASGSDGKQAEPTNVLAKFDLILDYLEIVVGNNNEHLNRLETL